MAIHQLHTFSTHDIASNVEVFPHGKRARAASLEPLADKFVVFAVLAFVLGLLSLFAFAASRHGPEDFAKDTALMTMYGP